MTSDSTFRISRFAAEIATACATAILGLTVVVGALEYGVGWGASGPEAGTFPFAVGLLIVAASLVNALQARRHRPGSRLFLDRIEAKRVAAFFGPMALFLAASMALGLYLAMALYLCGVMRFQGGYRLVSAVAVAIAVALFFYVVLELWFKVPLLKGPLEAALGLG